MTPSTDTTTELHPALAEIVEYLDGTDVEALDPHWVIFDISDGYVEADVKDGMETIRLRAYLVEFGPGADATEQEVVEWVARQPAVVGGILQALCVDEDDESIYLPRIVFECPIGEFTTLSGIWKNQPGEIAKFGEAWRERAIAESPTTAPMLLSWYRNPPSGRPFTGPRNAWLLMGGEASYLSADTLALADTEGQAGIFDSLWTAPRNAEVGDLVLIYFVAPTKAAHFVARVASRAFWRTDLEVDADSKAGNKQWWAYLTPPVEIEPISYESLKNAQNGHLLLRGRSGHFLHPETIEALKFTAKNPMQQADVDRIARKPIGLADLPPKEDLTFDQWKEIAAGALRLEADVSNYLVEPMLRWAMDQDATVTRLLAGYEREYRVPSGSVDFVIKATHPAEQKPITAIEVKLAIQRPKSGHWSDSTDFMQLRRYMDALDSRGILMDAQSIFLVEKGANAPFQEIRRADADEDKLMKMLRYFPIGRHLVKEGGAEHWQ